MEKPRTRREWEIVAGRLAEKILDALDCGCAKSRRRRECFEAWLPFDVSLIASVYGRDMLRKRITEEELELLSEMPDDVYEEFSRSVKSEIERMAEEAMREEKLEEEAGRARCAGCRLYEREEY